MIAGIKRSLLPIILVLAVFNCNMGADAMTQTKVAYDASIEKWSDKKIGEDIPCASWINPKVKPWAALLCIHGLSLHANNYAAFGKKMSDIGVPTYAIDVRGFGSWQNAKDKQHTLVDFKAAL